MDVIALVPGLIALAVCLAASPARAFLLVYLPALVLLPSTVRWELAGLPDIGFQHAAIMPIALAVALTSLWRWTLSITDVLVIGLVGIMALSEIQAGGMRQAQDSLVHWTCSILLPYFVARWLIEDARLRTSAAKVFVALMAVVALLSVWEFRLGSNPIFADIWSSFFGDRVMYANQYRFGFARIQGPFRHSILTGMVFGVAILMQVGLHRARAWRSPLVSRALLAILAGGSLMTLSRGPWIALAAALLVVLIGALRHRPRLMVGSILGCMLLGLLVLTVVNQWAVAGLDEADSSLQQTVSYRRQLLDVYMPLVWAKPLLGWGDLGWSVTESMESVDNYFLLLSLNHGLVATVTFCLLVLWVALRLVRFAARRPETSPDGRFACVLLASLVCLMLAITTAWLGGQTQPLLYLLLGWAEGLVGSASARAHGRTRRSARPMSSRATAPATTPAASAGFRRLLTSR